MTAEPLEPPARKSRLPGLLKLAGTLAMFGVLLLIVPLHEVIAAFGRINPLVWIGVFVAHLVGHAFAAAKWRALIGEPIPYLTAFKAHFAGLAAALALPGVAGGDVVRAGVMMRTNVRKTDLVLASLIDRIIDTAVLLAISAIGVAMLGAEAGGHLGWVYAAAAIIMVVGVSAVMLLGPIAKLIGGVKAGGKVGKLAALLSEGLARMSRRKGTIFMCVALSGAIQAGFAILNAILSGSIGGPDSIALWLFASPLAKLIATLPISIGGLGVREASLSGLMAPFTAAASASIVAASLMWQTIIIAAGLFGMAIQAAPLDRKRTMP